jgi:hypothetical protein
MMQDGSTHKSANQSIHENHLSIWQVIFHVPENQEKILFVVLPTDYFPFLRYNASTN